MIALVGAVAVLGSSGGGGTVLDYECCYHRERLRTSRGQVLEGDDEVDNFLGVEGEAFE